MKLFKGREATNVQLYNISCALTQIYGELNRIRLITSDPKRFKEIEKFDKEHNHYAPFDKNNDSRPSNI